MKSLFYCTFILVLIATVQSNNTLHVDYEGIGDRLLRTYTEYDTLPHTLAAAIVDGWVYHNQTTNACNPSLGISATYKANTPTTDYPLNLFFTKGGQLSGVGITIYGDLEQNLINKGFFKKVSNGEYHMTVSFRGSEHMCDGSQSPLPIGDRLVINADTIAYSVPVTAKQSVVANYTGGSCFYSMGTHWFYDLADAPQMSWEAKNLMPVVPMYTADGKLNAFFFASTVIQNGLFSSHWWEPVPLANMLMCKNWCDSACTFSGTNFWSTMHIYLRDYEKATCAGGCSIACCPGK